jgi:hypothetical protein
MSVSLLMVVATINFIDSVTKLTVVERAANCCHMLAYALYYDKMVYQTHPIINTVYKPTIT